MILLFSLLIVALAKPAGNWIHAIYGRENMPLGVIERVLCKLAGIDPMAEHNWIGYSASLMLFNIAGIICPFAILKLQHVLPLNPQGFPAVKNLLVFNTAVSFISSNNWQNYSGVNTMSHL